MIQDGPLSIEARMDPPPGCGSGVEETVDMVIRFPRAEASLHLSWQAPYRRNFGKVVGECGALSINDDHILLVSEGYPPVRYEFPEALSAGSHHPEWMDRVVEEFSHEIADNRLRGANLIEARRCVQLIELAYRSSREASCPMKL
jgi:hypothetical protein